MGIYDMMKNPGVSVEDIVARQAMTGSSYLLKGDDSDSAKSSDAKKAKRIRQVYQYIRENKDTGYAVPWSQWVEKADAAAGTADPAQMTEEAAATEAAD